MESEAIKLLDALGEKFGLAIDWTSENVYPYLQKLSGKYVRYELITSVLWLLFSVGLIILGIYLINKGKCYFKKADEVITSLTWHKITQQPIDIANAANR